MEAYVMVFTLAFSLILMLFSFFGQKAGWAMLGLFGAAIAFLCALVLASDGSLTNNGLTLAAANGNFISDFNMISWVPIIVGLGESFVTIRRVFHI
jgi:hypothetical protein